MPRRYPDDDPGDEYDPIEEGPEAQMYREEGQEELRLGRLIDRFLASLTPADAHCHLFTFTEMKEWLLMHKRFTKRGRA